MSKPATINPRIVEALYCEALVLADEVRAAFALPAPPARIAGAAGSAPPIDADLVRVAHSCEGLLATTRMMQAIAWLLNHRAYFLGEISDLQLRRHGRLPPAATPSDPANLALLDPATARLVETTRHFHERLLRLESAWWPPAPRTGGAIARLRERIEGPLAG